MIALNIFCYIITGVVFVYLFINLVFDILYNHQTNYYGLKRVINFGNTLDRRFYLLPSISISSWTFDDDGGVEIFIDWFKFSLYITYTKELEKYNKE